MLNPTSPGHLPSTSRAMVLAFSNSCLMARRLAVLESSAKSGSSNPICAVEMMPTPPAFATALEQEGKGYVVASLGEASGYVPYTAYSAKQSYLAAHPDLLQAFTNALQKGMDYVQTHTPEEIAKVIQPQFAETDLDTITAIVTRYYEQDTWKSDLIFEQSSFDLLQNILKEAGELPAWTPYEDLVTTTFAAEASESAH